LERGEIMMNQEKGTFEPIPDLFRKELEAANTRQEQERILSKCPRPTLYVGEVVEVKSVKFTVTRIKADGKLGLKMNVESSPAPEEK
jgi:hypothetical protein